MPPTPQCRPFERPNFQTSCPKLREAFARFLKEARPRRIATTSQTERLDGPFQITLADYALGRERATRQVSAPRFAWKNRAPLEKTTPRLKKRLPPTKRPLDYTKSLYYCRLFWGGSGRGGRSPLLVDYPGRRRETRQVSAPCLTRINRRAPLEQKNASYLENPWGEITGRRREMGWYVPSHHPINSS